MLILEGEAKMGLISRQPDYLVLVGKKDSRRSRKLQGVNSELLPIDRDEGNISIGVIDNEV